MLMVPKSARAHSIKSRVVPKSAVARERVKFCIRGLLGKDQRDTLTELCDVTHLLCAETVNIKEVDALEYRVHRVLSLLERDFPQSIHVITTHLLHHLPMYLKRFGPTYGFWMFPMERFNSWISRRILNRRFPEANVMETYRLFEFASFLQLTGQLPNGSTTDINPISESEDETEASDITSMAVDLPCERGHPGTIEECIVKDLISCYQSIYPVYVYLLSRYKKEKHAAKRENNVYDFPSFSQWYPTKRPMLSENEKSLLVDPSRDIIQFYAYTIRGKNNRLIKYGTSTGERVNSVHVSSYVRCCSADCDEVVFGRIITIFSHKFNENVHTLAHVHWYESATCDPQSGLYYCTLGSSNPSIPKVMLLLNLSRPLIHAVCEHKIWFMDNNY